MVTWKDFGQNLQIDALSVDYFQPLQESMSSENAAGSPFPIPATVLAHDQQSHKGQVMAHNSDLALSK